jgi:RES domain-containing protein
VVYFAESPSAAMLEILVHCEIDRDDFPETYQLLKVEADNGIAAENVAIESLPEHWKHSETVTRTVGDEWLRLAKTALLRVPSAIMPETWNWLLNPRHGDASRVQVSKAGIYRHDLRLFKK